MKIEVGEYCRTKTGNITKVVKVKDTVIWTDDFIDVYGRYNEGIIEKTDIVKHSNNIIDLIEVGDILKLKDGEKWEVQEHQGDGNWIQTEWEVIENEEDFKNKVDSILTHEQFSSLEYKI